MSDYWTENGLIKPASRIVCAANKHKESGRIICGPRHWDSTMRSQKLECEKYDDFEQGFINQFGEFLTREEAWIIAEEEGQIRNLCYDNQKGYLYSENFIVNMKVDNIRKEVIYYMTIGDREYKRYSSDHWTELMYFDIMLEEYNVIEESCLKLEKLFQEYQDLSD